MFLNMKLNRAIQILSPNKRSFSSTTSKSIIASSKLPTIRYSNNNIKHSNNCGHSQNKRPLITHPSAISESGLNGDMIFNIFQQNQKWRTDNQNEFENNIDGVLATQTPTCTLLSCCDSRVPAAAVGFGTINQSFGVKNIGNQAASSIGSLEYGLQVLQTPYAVVMGHTNCGAIRGASSDYRELHSMIQKELLSLVRAIRFCEQIWEAPKEMDFDTKCNILAEMNVDFQISQLLDDWNISNKVANGDLTIVGMMFDIHNAYGMGHGQIHFVNINGNTNVKSIRESRLFNDLTEEEKKICVTRLFKYLPGYKLSTGSGSHWYV